MALGKSASGPILGYLYQFERALFWLSIKDIDFVAIETEDDIVVQLGNKDLSQIFEQDKHSTGDNNPFTDRNINVWKTFEIWCKIQKQNMHMDFRLLYSSNKSADPKNFICKLAAHNVIKNFEVTEIDTYYTKFLKLGESLDGSPKDHFDAITRDYSVDIIKRMLSKVMINSDSLYHDYKEFKENVLTNLRISEDFIKNELYTYLLGWLVDNVCLKWKAKEEGIIYASEILTVKDNYISNFKNKPFIEQAISLLPLKEVSLEDHDENFIKQLSLIDANDDDKINAILNFQRANLERDRWAKSGTIPFRSDIENFDSNLQDNWSTVHEIENIEKPHLDDQKRGKLVYLKCHGNINFKIANYKVEQKYTVQGGLHILANQLKIGWHPTWKEKFDEN